jgi:hypothetical protein
MIRFFRNEISHIFPAIPHPKAVCASSPMLGAGGDGRFDLA